MAGLLSLTLALLLSLLISSSVSFIKKKEKSPVFPPCSVIPLLALSPSSVALDKKGWSHYVLLKHQQLTSPE